MVRNASSDTQAESCPKSKLTLRVVVLIIVLSCIASLVALGSPIWGAGWIVHVSREDLPSQLGVGVLLLLSLISFRGGKITKILRAKLTKAELFLLYIVTGFMIMMASEQALHHLLALIARFPFEYMRNPGEYSYFEYMSPRLYPRGAQVLKDFFMGEARVPWSAWIEPLFFWFLVYGAMFFLLYAMACVFYHRWSEEERLSFPLTAPIVALTDVVKGASSSEYSLRNKFFVSGLAIPVMLKGLSILHSYFPMVPTIPLGWEMSKFTDGGLREILGAFPGTWFRLSPYAIGIGYLAPTDFCFSLWFFYYIFHRLILQGALYNSGIGSGEFSWYSNSVFNGGAVAMAMFLVWLGRDSIKKYVAAAFRPNQADAHVMPMSPTIFVGGIILSLTILFGLGKTMLSIAPQWMLFHLFLLISYGLVFGRFRAEVGLPFVNGAPLTYHVARTWFGAQAVPLPTRVGLVQISQGTIWSGASTSGWVMEGFRFGDYANMERRSVLKALAIAFVVIFVIGCAVSLKTFYWEGMGINIAPELANSPINTVGTGIKVDTSPLRHSFTIGIAGGILTLLFGFLRARFVWWPFHPLGFILGFEMGTGFRFPGPFFIAWLIKILVLRYAGVSLFNKLRPFFIALIVSDVCMDVLAAVTKSVEVMVF